MKKAWLLCSTQSSGKTDTQRGTVGAVMEMCTRYNKNLRESTPDCLGGPGKEGFRGDGANGDWKNEKSFA